MPDEKNSSNFSDDLKAWAKKKISSKDFAARALRHLESPEWKRRNAQMEAETLKAQKAGRERLFGLIKEHQTAGRRIDYEFYPLRHGHDSVMVTVWNKEETRCRRTGFPSFLDTSFVESGFGELVEGADKSS